MSAPTLRIENETRGSLLGERVRLADGWWSRLRGLLGRPEPEAGEGLMIVPSRGVHMFGMRYPLDVLLLDDGGEVLEAYESLEPWSRTGLNDEARYALELPTGTVGATGTEPGDRLSWTNTPNEGGAG